MPGTIVYVTHDQVEAMTMGDRIGVMDGGRLAQVGTPLDVYRRPANRFVAGFIGTPPMSFLAGGVADEEGRAVFRGDGLSVSLPERLGAAVLASDHGREGWSVGIRPESVEVAASNGGPPSSWKVDVVEHLGAECVVGLRCGEAFLRGRLGAETEIAVDSAVDVTLPPGRLHVFAPDGSAVRP